MKTTYHTGIHCIGTSGETKLTFNSVPNFTKELPAKEDNVGKRVTAWIHRVRQSPN